MNSHTRLRPTGVALVIVLAFLVLISAITLGFFSSVSTELASSKAVSNSALTRQLADSAVNVIMSQLVDATRGQTDDRKALAWASQPGMIRTFNAAGGPDTFYKLYSSDYMSVAGSGFDAATDAVPTDWKSAKNTEYYTDLNAPASDSDGHLVYPIIDPSADGQSPEGGTASADGFKVDGFSLPSSPGFEPGTVSPVNHRAPMPVKWLYALKDGTLKSASAPNDTGVTVNGATAANPIVGRIAFWTDDETAKVNINTASEGIYWDIPRIYSLEDVGAASGIITPGSAATTPGLALCQPANREYQRYPGHPATTSLSPVFGKLLPSPVPSAANNYKAIAAGTAVQLDVYNKIAPRVSDPDIANANGSSGGTRIPKAPLNTDSDRLYASIDELMFKPAIDASGKRLANTSTTSAPKLLTKAALEKSRFFITANSNAPEVTLFNTPRVGIWPVHVTPGNRTAFDKLAAFCATVGATTGRSEYYFTRKNARSATEDFSTRNGEIYNYLKALTSRPIPGFGGKFSDKYPAGGGPASDCEQILTSIYDYIRCVNLSDTSPGATLYTPLTNFLMDPATSTGAGEVVPIRIASNNTQGFGRFATVAELDLLLYATSASAMRAVVLLEFGSPMQGNVGYQSRMKYRITGLGPLGLSLPDDGTNFVEISDLHTHHGRGLGGLEGPAMAFLNKNWLAASTTKNLAPAPGTATKGNYPFFSSADIPFAKGLFSIPETKIKIEILTADTTTYGNQVVQTLNLTIPATKDIKAPTYVADTADFKVRINRVAAHAWDALITPGDTVLAMQIAGVAGKDNTAGDIRLVAPRIEAPATAYQTHKDWNATAANAGKAHGLLTGLGLRYTGAKFGPLVANANYMGGGDRQPGIPSRVSATTGVTRADGSPGDWDTGTGLQKDGAYLNKADEGDQQFDDQADGNGKGKRIPYISKDDHFLANGTIFSPNRQIASPLMFGSIPTGVQRNLPWQTLLFHPRPEDSTHPGKISGQPKDHLLADFFWMPVVEPYAISQPLATNGKINLNYQIQPFTYIKRSTGLHAVMKATQFMALTVNDAVDYKPHIFSWPNPAPKVVKRRYSIDMTKTLAAFDTKFANNEIFKSATEICEMNLVPPEAASAGGMATFWNANKLTGDNLREKPYVDIYPRLTTKSNSFTVHVRVQALKKAPGAPANQWVTGRDKVVGEYRGSSLLERYIDVNDASLPDFAKQFAGSPSDPDLNIDKYYKMRVVSTKRFAP